MNKNKKLTPNQGLVPKMIHPPFSLQAFMRKLKTKQALLQQDHAPTFGWLSMQPTDKITSMSMIELRDY